MEALSKLALCFLFACVLVKGCGMVAQRDRILGSLMTVTFALGWAQLMASH